MTFEWYEGTRFFIFFLFRNNGKRESNWMKTVSVAVMVNFFRKRHSESTWSQLCSKFFLKDYEAPWQRHLKDTLHLKILQTWINLGVKPAPRHMTYYCMIECWCWSNNFCHNLFGFLPLIQYLYAFFIRTSKILMRLHIVFCKGLQPQNVIFYFLRNISTC